MPDLNLGVFHNGVLVAEVPADPSIPASRRADEQVDRAYRILAELSRDKQGLEVLRRCPNHPDTSIVDCTVCDPDDEG